MLLANPFIDIHTHRDDLENVISIKSLNLLEINQSKLSSHSSVGIHPWWLEELSSSDIEDLKIKIFELGKNHEVKAIGETGIDRSIEVEIKDQVDLFEWHVHLSEELKRPLYIHSVRAISDILGMIKMMKPQMPWIFHDFRGNDEMVKEISRLHPLSFFSFGLSIDNSQKIRDLIPQIPLAQLFLETDAQKHLTIEEIYLRASHFIGMEPDFLRAQLYYNFKKVFNL